MNDRNKTKTTDNSVLCALAELGALEQGRIEREQNKRAAAQAAARDAEQRAAQAEAQRLAAEEAARTEAQLRAALEIDAKAKAEAERDQRMAAMRAELESIQAERSLLRAEVLSRSALRPEPPRRGYGIAFGLSSVVAAALAGALVVQAQRPEPITPRYESSYEPSVSVVERAPSAPEMVTAPTIEHAPALEVAAPAEAAPTEAAVARTRRHPHRDRTRETVTTDDRHALERGLDFGEGEGFLPGDAHRAR